VGMYWFFRWMRWIGPHSLEREQREARAALGREPDAAAVRETKGAGVPSAKPS
jgi:hypothetical protein